jgi:hypothetical protein
MDEIRGVRCYRVVSRAELEDAERTGIIACSRDRWHHYAPNTTVFVFLCRHEADGFAPNSGREDPVLLTLVVDGANLEVDDSAERGPAHVLAELAPELAGLPVETDGSGWESSHAHKGPIPFTRVVAVEPAPVN